MQQLDEKTLRAVLGELIVDELKAIHEILADVPIMKQDIKTLKENMTQVKSDITVIKSVVTDQSKQLGGHEHRITQLEFAHRH